MQNRLIFLCAVLIPSLPVLGQSSVGDHDGDIDVDLTDFLTFANCFNGSLRPPQPGCPVPTVADITGDTYVDGLDFLTFSNCFNGSGNNPRPGCGGCIVDLDIDTDNSDNFPDFVPQRDAAEDMNEDSATLPGKYVSVNHDDDDGDFIADFADTFDLDGVAGNDDDDNTQDDDFVRLVFEIPGPIDVTKAKVKVTYSASDPSAATAVGSPAVVTTAPGRLRIWTKIGNQPRDKRLISAGGNYVGPATYDATDFGLSNTGRVVNLWIEGIASSPSPGGDRILFQVDPDGDTGPARFNCWDAVRLTVLGVDLDVDSDNTSTAPPFAPQRTATEEALELDDLGPGRIIWVNRDDDDTDKIIDYGDGFDLDATGGNDDDLNDKENDFVKMVFEIPPIVDMAKARIEVSYDASDPAAATSAGTPPVVTLAPGLLRIWKKEPTAGRNAAKIDAGGDYVAPGTYTPAQLGLSAMQNKVELWVEAVRSVAIGPEEILFLLNPDSTIPVDSFRFRDRVFLGLCEIRVVNRALAAVDHVAIGTWGADDGAGGLTGYDGTGAVVNAAGGTFIDVDPERFLVEVTHGPANTNMGMMDTIQVAIGTRTSTDAADDGDDNITLTETGNNTSVFRSEAQLLMMPDLQAADNPDDNFAVRSTVTMGNVNDDNAEDRTHRTSVDGRLRATYATIGGSGQISLPVCDRKPNEERRILNVQLHVFNEPWQDVGLDGMPGTGDPDGSEGNAMFDFTDTNGNTVHDNGEPSEPFMNISGGAVGFGLAGSWGPIWSPGAVQRELTFIRSYLSPACIRLSQVGPILFRNPTGTLFLTTPGFFDDFPDDDGVTGTPTRDEAVIQANFRSAVNLNPGTGDDIVDIYFVAPFTAAGGAFASQFRPGFVAAQGLNANLINQVHIGFNTVACNVPFASVHELFHQLTNQSDVATPNYIFFPTTGAAANDGTTLTTKRRATRMTFNNARALRPAGNMAAVGNQLLRMLPP